MREMGSGHNIRYIRYVLITLGVILIILFVFLVVQYRVLRDEQILNDRALRSAALERHAPLPPDEASVIRSWMTFDYVNRIFGLPSDYLRSRLDITDSRYPRLSIGSYAKTAGVDVTTLLNNLEAAISFYVSPVIVTSTPIGATKST